MFLVRKQWVYHESRLYWARYSSEPNYGKNKKLFSQSLARAKIKEKVKLMKRIIVAFLVMSLGIGLCACGGNMPVSEATNPIITSTAPTENIEQQLAEENYLKILQGKYLYMFFTNCLYLFLQYFPHLKLLLFLYLFPFCHHLNIHLKCFSLLLLLDEST